MNLCKENVLRSLQESATVLNDSEGLSEEILRSVKEIINCIKSNNKILIFGNGGSAADAQHMAAEFVGRYLLERDGFPAIALTTDSSVLTAVSNDYNFEMVFSRQCKALVNQGDVIFAISTSGKSKNVINGVRKGKEKGAKIISLTGKTGNELENLSDVIIRVPSISTPRIQEAHRTIIHIICEMVEKNIN